MAQQSLFGDVFTPEQTQRAIRGKRAAEIAQLSPLQVPVYTASKRGQLIGEGLMGAFGFETPEQARANKLKSVIDQFPNLNPQDPEQLTQVQAALMDAGLYQQAERVGENINEIRTTQASLLKGLKGQDLTTFQLNVREYANNILRCDYNDPTVGEDGMTCAQRAEKSYTLGKRAGPEEKGAGAFATKYADIWGGEYKDANEKFVKASDARTDQYFYNDMVTTEIERLGGIQEFIDEYRKSFGPTGNFVAGGEAIFTAMNWNVTDPRRSMFKAGVEKRSLKGVMNFLKGLGGSDTERELKEGVKDTATFKDNSPMAFLYKIAIMDLETDVNEKLAVMEVDWAEKAGRENKTINRVDFLKAKKELIGELLREWKNNSKWSPLFEKDKYFLTEGAKSVGDKPTITEGENEFGQFIR